MIGLFLFVGFLKTCCSHGVRELDVSLKIVQTTLEQTHFFRCGAIVKISHYLKVEITPPLDRKPVTEQMRVLPSAVVALN